MPFSVLYYVLYKLYFLWTPLQMALCIYECHVMHHHICLRQTLWVSTADCSLFLGMYTNAVLKVPKPPAYLKSRHSINRCYTGQRLYTQHAGMAVSNAIPVRSVSENVGAHGRFATAFACIKADWQYKRPAAGRNRTNNDLFGIWCVRCFHSFHSVHIILSKP